MTSPPTRIDVVCPKCGRRYEDWYRASINLQMDHFDEEYLIEASTATCPDCHTRVDLGVLVVDENGTWHLPVSSDDSAQQNEQRARE